MGGLSDLPDLVVLNFARSANREKIMAYSASRIRVAILCTEGGVFTNFELTNLVKLSAPEPIDIYCLWDEKQHESFWKTGASL